MIIILISCTYGNNSLSKTSRILNLVSIIIAHCGDSHYIELVSIGKRNANCSRIKRTALTVVQNGSAGIHRILQGIKKIRITAVFYPLGINSRRLVDAGNTFAIIADGSRNTGYVGAVTKRPGLVSAIHTGVTVYFSG